MSKVTDGYERVYEGVGNWIDAIKKEMSLHPEAAETLQPVLDTLHSSYATISSIRSVVVSCEAMLIELGIIPRDDIAHLDKLWNQGE